MAPRRAAVARTGAMPARAGFLTSKPSDASARRRGSAADSSVSARPRAVRPAVTRRAGAASLGARLDEQRRIDLGVVFDFRHRYREVLHRRRALEAVRHLDAVDLAVVRELGRLLERT